MRLAARIAVVLVAVPVIAWLAVSYDDARKIQHGSNVLAKAQPSRGEIASALADARAANRWTEPTESLSVQAALEIRAGRRDLARNLLEQIVRREPDFADAWQTLSDITRTSDPALSAQAAAQVKRLDPLHDKGH